MTEEVLVNGDTKAESPSSMAKPAQADPMVESSDSGMSNGNGSIEPEPISQSTPSVEETGTEVKPPSNEWGFELPSLFQLSLKFYKGKMIEVNYEMA